MKVNGREHLIKMIRSKYPFLSRCSKDIVDDIFSELHNIIDGLEPDDSVTILKFGRFKKTRREERNTVNPSNGEKMTVPAHDIIRFKYTKNKEQ